MTPWHLSWQNLCTKDSVEVVITKNDKKHIADIYDKKDGLVIEIQHSYISAEDIEERETFYEDMIWIIDTKIYG